MRVHKTVELRTHWTKRVEVINARLLFTLQKSRKNGICWTADNVRAV